MNRKQRIADINARLQSFDTELDAASQERMAEIEKETRTLVEERTRLILEEKAEIRKAFESGEELETLGSETRRMKAELDERHAKDLQQKRAITLTGDLTVLHQDHKKTTLNDTFNQVSSLVDRVRYVYLPGGETYSEPYIKGYGTASVTVEGAAYGTGDPVWGYSEIKKVKLTIYMEVSEEFEKLGFSDYMRVIKQNLSVAIRKKLVYDIIKGSGASGQLSGILGATQPHLEASKDLEVSAIDENTLDNIILSYGGDEDVAGGVLILNKKDLKAFALVKSTTTKKSAYEIDYKNSTINGVPYIISSAITDLATTAAGSYSMVYGSLYAYVVAQFSDIELKRSDDFKFNEGLVAFRASGFFGGNVAMWNGFLRIKKPTI
jgi:HK97 family phage major capsid protein